MGQGGGAVITRACSIREVAQGGKYYLLRSELLGTAGHVFQSVGVAAPPTVQEVN